MFKTVFENEKQILKGHTHFMGGLNILDRCHSYGNFNINRCGVLMRVVEKL